SGGFSSAVWPSGSCVMRRARSSSLTIASREGGMSSSSGHGPAVRRVLIQVLFLNLAVAGAKAVYAAWSGSLAIASDAVHSFTDAGSNVMGLVVMRFASAPPDAGHPYGHRKLDIVAAAGIGVAIGAVAVRFGYSAVSAL